MRKVVLSLALMMAIAINAQTTYKVRISWGTDKSLTATFDDNATSRALIAMMPMTLPMLDLYDDEMCYRFTNNPLPTDNVQYYLHEKGEIFYWPPGPSFVIRYIETDEYLSIQHIGKVDSGVEQMAGIGNTDMTFELISDETALDDIKASSLDGCAFTLTGQVAPEDYKGVVIQNGQKRIIK